MSKNKILFEVDQEEEANTRFYVSTMLENREILYKVVERAESPRIVELGTYEGCSYFSMAQALKDGAYDGELFGVDHWCGDLHCGNYEDDVFEFFDRVRGKYFDINKVKIIVKNFEEAADDFEENSVDILLIDGFHTYGAVKHDYETWLPKVKEGGLVMFHDTRVDRGSFGVKKFWEELTSSVEHGCFFEVKNNNGLGLIYPKGGGGPEKWDFLTS